MTARRIRGGGRSLVKMSLHKMIDACASLSIADFIRRARSSRSEMRLQS